MCPLCRPAQLRAPDPQILLPPSLRPPLLRYLSRFARARFVSVPAEIRQERQARRTMARPVLILSLAGRLSASVGVFGEVAIGNPFKSWTMSPRFPENWRNAFLLNISR